MQEGDPDKRRPPVKAAPLSGWNDLVQAGLRVVPFDGTPPRSPRRRALFSATLTQTTKLLRRELEMLAA